jgi:glycosyltransferase involved in cell wall biosynthesis
VSLNAETMTLFVDQTPGPLMVDIVNGFAAEGPVSLFSGHVIEANVTLRTDVTMTHSVRYRRNTLFLRVLTWAAFSTHYFFYLFIHRFERIVVVTNPPTAPIITRIIARATRTPYFIILYDLYPDAAEQVGLFSRSSYFFSTWKKANRAVFGSARKIFTISDTMKKAVSQYVSADKIITIHNWADTSYIKPIPKHENVFLSSHKLGGKRVVLYAGNMGLTHDLESLVEAARLLSNRQDVVFIMVGDGSKKRKLSDMAAGMPNILFFPYQDATSFPQVMAAADIGVVTLGTGAEGISVPSKTYVNMAAGLCLLAISEEGSELAEIISRYDVGVRCSPRNPALLMRTICQLLEDNEMLERYKMKSLHAVTFFTKANVQDYLNHVRQG